ncbi:hypothetical protein [Sphingobacterium lactis]|uniref:hypothetical protein n=1 Tax=Sphingobacterium lactis TaxID=797291 RepID=UPI003DA4C844
MAKLTLLTSKGTMHHVGGLNWGANKKNHTRKLDAYIPLHKSTILSNLTLIKPKSATNNPIKVVWNCGTVMYCKFEGTVVDNRTGIKYPKQISSYPNKDILGKFFRKRLNINSSRKITLQDLQSYGRTDIDFIYNPLNNHYDAIF